MSTTDPTKCSVHPQITPKYFIPDQVLNFFQWLSYSRAVLFNQMLGWHRLMYRLTPFISRYCPSHICSHFTCVIQQYVGYGFVVSSCIIPEVQDALQWLSTARQVQNWKVCIVLKSTERSPEGDKCICTALTLSDSSSRQCGSNQDGDNRLLLVTKFLCKLGNFFTHSSPYLLYSFIQISIFQFLFDLLLLRVIWISRPFFLSHWPPHIHFLPQIASSSILLQTSRFKVHFFQNCVAVQLDKTFRKKIAMWFHSHLDTVYVTDLLRKFCAVEQHEWPSSSSCYSITSILCQLNPINKFLNSTEDVFQLHFSNKILYIHFEGCRFCSYTNHTAIFYKVRHTDAIGILSNCSDPHFIQILKTIPILSK